MRIGGKEVKSAWEPDPVVFSRGRDADGQPILIAFRARGLRDYDEFESLCPMPQAKTGYFTKDAGWTTDDKSQRHLDALKQWREQRYAYYVIKSLEPSGIEWEKVDLQKPATWKHYEAELKSVLTEIEFSQVIRMIDEANSIDSAKLEENRQTFFQQQGELAATTGQRSEAENSPLSAPVSVAG